MRRLITLLPLPLLPLLVACTSQSEPIIQVDSPAQPLQSRFLLESQHDIHPLSGDFSENQAAARFIDKMVKKHGFERQQLHDVLVQAQKLDWVIRLMDKQAPASAGRQSTTPNGAWIRYRSKFLTPDNIQNGVAFWDQHQQVLERAWQVYGVPPEIIVGIIGVETRWGRVMGKTRIIDALATLAFSYPRRADYFTAELETFLLMASAEGKDPLSLRGSYAGAMGYGQFMPSSFNKYAVDFNGDNHINLWDPVDAIGSVANYFKSHGWQRGGTVAVPAIGQALGLPTGFKTSYPVNTLAAAGLTPQGSLEGNQQVSLLRLDLGNRYQYWYGLPNFYVITRYNHSVHYSMAVWQLGKAVAKARRS